MGFGNFFKGLPVIGNLFGSDDDDGEKQQSALDSARAANKAKQYEYLNQMRGPVQAEATRRRIAALEGDAAEAQGPLSQNRYFQGQRAQAVQGGQQALSGVQNQQRAHGVSGGFSNVGSTQDAYDRLSGQLARIGSQAAERGERARDEAASGQQAWEDSQVDFWNNQMRAKMGIESEDALAAMDAINKAYGAKQASADRSAKERGGYAESLIKAFGKRGV